MSAICSRQLVFAYALPLLLRSLSSAVRPNPRWSYVNTAAPRAANAPCAHSYRPQCSTKPWTNTTTACAGGAPAGGAYVRV